MVAKSEDELNRMLYDPHLGEFIYEQPSRGELKFIFQHALTRDVAYNSLLTERRKLLHGGAGRAIEALYADALDDQVVALADHLRRAGNAMKASGYLHRTGVLAAKKAAFPEAVSHLRESLELEAELWRLYGELTLAADSSKAEEAEHPFNGARELGKPPKCQIPPIASDHESDAVPQATGEAR